MLSDGHNPSPEERLKPSACLSYAFVSSGLFGDIPPGRFDTERKQTGTEREERDFFLLLLCPSSQTAGVRAEGGGGRLSVGGLGLCWQPKTKNADREGRG